MELQQLLYFETLCEYKSFARAAAALYIAPSTLTSSVKRLEAELNTMLIIRNNHTFILTPTGKLLLRCAQRVRENLSTFQAAIAPAASDTDSVRIGLAIPLCSMRLLENINLFGEEHPNISTSVVRNAGGNICNFVNSNTVDFGIVLSRHLNIRNLEYFHFENMEYGVYLPLDHEWASFNRITPEMFIESKQTIISSKGGLKYALDKYFEHFNIELIESNFTNMYIENVLHYIALHMGIAILPIDSADDTPGVKCVPFDPPFIVEHLFVWNKLIVQQRSALMLMNYLIEHRLSES